MNNAIAYDREIEDVGNIVKLEHVNLGVPDQSLATLFYVCGLGLTRDPYLMTGVDNMWINVGTSQFHLPSGQPQKLRGHIGLVAANVIAPRTHGFNIILMFANIKVAACKRAVNCA